MTASVVVIYDSACGGCSDIASDLDDVLGVPVLIRSCRDPNLVAEFPPLRAVLGERPCRRPLMITVGVNGRSVISSGAAMFWRGASLVRPRRWTAAVRLALRIGWRRLAS